MICRTHKDTSSDTELPQQAVPAYLPHLSRMIFHKQFF